MSLYHSCGELIEGLDVAYDIDGDDVRLTVDVEDVEGYGEAFLEPLAARQLAAALLIAANECERRRRS